MSWQKRMTSAWTCLGIEVRALAAAMGRPVEAFLKKICSKPRLDDRRCGGVESARPPFVGAEAELNWTWKPAVHVDVALVVGHGRGTGAGGFNDAVDDGQVGVLRVALSQRGNRRRTS